MISTKRAASRVPFSPYGDLPRLRTPPPPLWGRIEEGGLAVRLRLRRKKLMLHGDRPHPRGQCDPPPCPSPTRACAWARASAARVGEGTRATAVPCLEEAPGTT